MKTEGCQLEGKSHHSITNSNLRAHRAATCIQKMFRGYITRKYIDEAKYIISKVKVIQNWWRSIAAHRKAKLNNKLANSIQINPGNGEEVAKAKSKGIASITINLK